LVFDISPVALQQVAQTLSVMLKTVTGWEIVPVSLGTFESEDDLWGCLGLWSESEKQPLHWQSGLLGGGQKGSQLRLVVIPDLTKLSLAASRACVMLMGADVTHLERHGQHQHWRPRFCWLAGCLRTEVGMVSPHLLDRFALRLSGQIGETSDRVQEILEWFKKDEELGERISLDPIVLHSDLQKKLTRAKQQHSNLTPEAIERVFAYISDQEVYSLRREIALTRLSSGIAQLEGFDNIIVNHVRANASKSGTHQERYSPHLADNLYLKEFPSRFLDWTVRSSRKINEFTRVSAPNVLHPSSRLTIAERLSMQGF
jgi:magnesium chelatase subunit D